MPYSKRVIEDLKSMVPKACRTFDPATKVWCVDLAYLSILMGLLRRYFSDTAIHLDPRIPHIRSLFELSRDRRDKNYDSPYSALYLSEDAPWEVCQAAYRALAKNSIPITAGMRRK